MEQVGFQCKVLYRDNDVVKVRISGWNGTFGGAADVYIGAGQLSEIALRLRGFPGNGADVREVILGTFDSESAGGGVRMKFYCVSAAGHCRVEAKIAADPGPAGSSECAVLVLPIEASAVDLFVEALDQLDKATLTEAFLKGANAAS